MEILNILIERPLVSVAVALAAWTFFSAFIAHTRGLPNLPWVGKTSNKPGAEYWTTWASIANIRKWLKEGYHKFSKNGKPYIVADIVGKKHVVLPNDKLGWILDHPDNVLSVGAAHYDTLAGPWAFGDSKLLQDLFHEHVIHKSLARKLQDIVPRVWDGIGDTFDELWGSDTQQWKEFDVMDNMAHFVSRMSNFLFIGLPLAKNEEFLKAGRDFANDVILCSFASQMLPAPLKPILMPLIALPNRYHSNKVAKHVIPIIKQRIADMDEQDVKHDSKKEIPEDYLTWHIRVAKEEGKLEQLDPPHMVRCLMAIEFAANHTTLLTIVGAILDLLGSDPSKGYLEGIREEVERVYAESGQKWTKASLSKLIRTDSALRESMRMLDITFLVTRKVVAAEGVRNEEEGWSVPYGQYISVATCPHRDEDVYEDPNIYDAFRFSRPREEFEKRQAELGEDGDDKEWLKLQSMSLISTSKDFLPFGHGRHACPGRFFIQQELKMFLAYMVMNYDVQSLPERPKNFIWGPINAPPKTTIKIRRRKDRPA